MSLTYRKGIAWGTGPLMEPTDTLVLTSPGNHFVDIRLYLMPQSDNPYDWAFCGQVVAGPTTEYTHEIDSRSVQALANGLQPVVEADTGMSRILATGDEQETGVMWNPDAGQRQPFTEVWGRLDVNSVQRTPVLPATAPVVNAVVVVLCAQIDNQVFGKLVWVGKWMQAVACTTPAPGSSFSSHFGSLRATVDGPVVQTLHAYGKLAEHLRDILSIVLELKMGLELGQVISLDGLNWDVIELR